MRTNKKSTAASSKNTTATKESIEKKPKASGVTRSSSRVKKATTSTTSVAVADSKTVSAKESKKTSPADISSMITDAIVNLKDKNGSSKVAIMKYISSNYTVENDFESKFNNIIKKELKSGKLIDNKGAIQLAIIETKPVSSKKPKSAAKKSDSGNKESATTAATDEKATNTIVAATADKATTVTNEPSSKKTSKKPSKKSVKNDDVKPSEANTAAAVSTTDTEAPSETKPKSSTKKAKATDTDTVTKPKPKAAPKKKQAVEKKAAVQRRKVSFLNHSFIAVGESNLDDRPAVSGVFPSDNYTSQEKCEFVRTHSDDDEGFLNYTEFFYCQYQIPLFFRILILILQLVFLFVFIGTSASDYFCPNLTHLSNLFKLPPEVSGATLLVLGNSAPDLISSLIALNKDDESINMALGAIIGSCLFVGGLIFGSVCLIARSSSFLPIVVQLEPHIFIRDALFLLVSVVFVGLVAIEQKFFWWEGLILLLIYFFYLSLIIIDYIRDKRFNKSFDFSVHGNDSNTANSDSDYSESTYSCQSCGLIESTCCCAEANDTISIHSDIRNNCSQLNWKKRLRKIYERCRYGSISAGLKFSEVPDYHAEESLKVLSPDECLCNYCSQRHTLFSSQSLMDLGYLQLNHFFPLVFDWKELGYLGRAISIFNIPAVFFLSLTVPTVQPPDQDKSLKHVDLIDKCEQVIDPVVEDESTPLLCSKRCLHERIWLIHCKIVLIIQAICAPYFVVFAVKWLDYEIFPKIYGWMLASTMSLFLVVSLSLSYSVKQKTRDGFISAIGFVVGIFWIYFIANEVVSLLKAIGTTMNIDDSILGLTVFTFGNSIGDFVSNISMARMGYPTMAVSASFAGPLINLVLSLGIAGIMKPVTKFEITTTVFCAFCAVILMLVMYLIIIPFNRFQAGKVLGGGILVYYFVVISVTVALTLAGLEINGLAVNGK